MPGGARPSYFSSAVMMRSRVKGMSAMRTPNPWATALPIAAAVGPTVHSPTPSEALPAPSTSSASMSGTSLKRRIG